MDVLEIITALLVTGLLVRHLAKLISKSDKLVQAFKEAHEEIEKTGQTDIVFWSPMKR